MKIKYSIKQKVEIGSQFELFETIYTRKEQGWCFTSSVDGSDVYLVDYDWLDHRYLKGVLTKIK